MDKIKKYLPTRRKIIQLYAALLYNAHLKGFVSGEIYTGAAKNLCVPGLNCYSCPGAVGACPLGALQNALAGSNVRAPYYVLGMLMLLGLIFGRVVCGFLCPMGLIQELLYKIRTPKVRRSRFTRALSWVKYVILAVFVVVIPLYYALKDFPLPAFCKYICPAGTLEGAVGLLSNPANADRFSMLNLLFAQKFVILVLILAACVFVFRAFCRFLCPLGAIYGLFTKVALLGVQVDGAKCVDCGKCTRCCKCDVRRVGDHECIQCGECIGVCPTGAISWKGRKSSRRGRTVLWTAAILILVLALVCFNLPDPAPEYETGSAVGMLCPDFTAPVYGGGEFTTEQTRGKITVINFWATWCGPCVAELPHFQQLHDSYPEDVAVVAIHSDLITEDVQAYLDGTEYTLPFAQDETGGIIASLGGSTMLPMTVVLDRDGVIVYNRVGSVTYDALEALVEPLI